MKKVPATEIKKKKKVKRPRLPNGFGSIVFLSGNRRNPYWARKTTEFNEKGYPIYKTIGYFPDWIDAFQALSEYNKNPYDLNMAKLKFSQLYDLWWKRKFSGMKELSDSAKQSYSAAYKHCAILHDEIFADINSLQLQKVLDDCSKGRSTVNNIKILLGQLYKYALEFDIVRKDVSAFIQVNQQVVKSKKRAIPDKEVQIILQKIGTDGGDLAAILLYTGARINEIIKMKPENIFLEHNYMIGGSKTASGKDRIIPIHSAIKPIIERRLEKYGCLYQYKNKDYARIRIMKPFMESIGFDYLPHECRHTFVTKSDKVKMNKIVMKGIIGHRQSTLADETYTHKSIQELCEEIEKIHY